MDACSQEIACRPEVFAPAFRYLRYMAVAERSCLMPEVPPLRFTYHVGEDFLDVTDGLRAIDEAVRYLRLGAGMPNVLEAWSFPPRTRWTIPRGSFMCFSG